MGNFLNSRKISQRQRKFVVCILLALMMTNTQAQFASADELVPSILDKTINNEFFDGSQKAELKVPEFELITDPSTTKVSDVKPVKKWNKINAPDLDVKPVYSSDPAVRTMTVMTTAYTSDPRETDGSPFTTANGSQVRDGIVAANFLKFGTRIRIPDYFGDKVFEVHDRMNARYTQRVDLWMLNKADARLWGIRRVKIEILD